jgi:tetratricopeptide (TPR) repeat protein
VAPASPRVDDLIALIERGCFRCLEQAYETATARGARAQAFEAAVLLVARSKELGLPFAEWRGRAATLAADEDDALYMAIVDGLLTDRWSAERYRQFDEGVRNVRPLVPEWRESLRGGSGSPLLRAYLDIALVCGFGQLGETGQSFTGQLDPLAMTPLYQYAVGTCDSTKVERLRALRTAEPDFVDGDYALGRFLVEDPSSPDPEEGLRRLESARRAFPRSPAIATWVGSVHRGWEEWVPALAAYDAALELSPGHPDALIGRVIALSQLERAEEAIEAATRVISAGQWMQGEARYWRAWNYLRRGQYQQAREDADTALTQMSNARVHVLSGVIEWRMRRLESAEREFQQAVTIDFGECEGAFDLGIVRDELRRVPESLAAFRQAGQCNDLSLKLRLEAIAKIESGPGTPSSRAREAAKHTRALHELEERRDEIARAISALETVKSSK